MQILELPSQVAFCKASNGQAILGIGGILYLGTLAEWQQ
jgi:hypothetical protein